MVCRLSRSSGMSASRAGSLIHSRPISSRPKLWASDKQPHQAGEDQHAVHVPALRLRRGRDVVVRDGHDRNVVEQRQHDDHRRRQRLEPQEHDRRHHQQHDVERHRDAVVHVALDALEDLPRADDGVDDGREAGSRQDQGGGAARGVGGAADGDAAIGLAQGGASLTPSPVIATMWPRCCSALTISYLCCGNTRPKPSARSTAVTTSGGRVAGVVAVLEHIARHQQMVAHAELLGDLIADRDVVAGHHLDVEAKPFGFCDRRLGVRPRRVAERDDAEKLPALCPACHRPTWRRRAPDSRGWRVR